MGIKVGFSRQYDYYTRFKKYKFCNFWSAPGEIIEANLGRVELRRFFTIKFFKTFGKIGKAIESGLKSYFTDIACLLPEKACRSF